MPVDGVAAAVVAVVGAVGAVGAVEPERGHGGALGPGRGRLLGGGEEGVVVSVVVAVAVAVFVVRRVAAPAEVPGSSPPSSSSRFLRMLISPSFEVGLPLMHTFFASR